MVGLVASRRTNCAPDSTAILWHDRNAPLNSAIAEQSGFMSTRRPPACANVSRRDVPIDPTRLSWCPTRVRSPPSLLWSDSATVKTSPPQSYIVRLDGKFGAQPLALRRIHQLRVDGR